MIEQIQAWYLAQCDGEWEHKFGVTVQTLDNPGWTVHVDLTGTSLSGAPFTPVVDLSPETDWIDCRVVDDKWQGHGGPMMLERVLDTFLTWAREQDAEDVA